MSSTSRQDNAGTVIFLDRWGSHGTSEGPGEGPERFSTIRMRHSGSPHRLQETVHDGDRIWPLREDGLPEWFPAEAPVLRNSAVLMLFPDGVLHLRAMSNAGTRAVQLLVQHGYSLLVDSFEDVTVDTGVPITRYREISFTEPVPVSETAELGRMLRLSGVVLHSYAGYFDAGMLRFRRIGGVSAFPGLRVLHRTVFDGEGGHQYFGHPRQLRLLSRLLEHGAAYEAVPDESGGLGSLVLPSTAAAVTAERQYQDEFGGLVVADSYGSGGRPGGSGDFASAQNAA